MSGDEDTARQPAETDKPSEHRETTDESHVDVIDAMKQRVELSKKSEEKHTRLKTFSLGDGGFSIVGLEEAAKQYVPKTQTAEAKDGGRTGDSGVKSFTPKGDQPAAPPTGDVPQPGQPPADAPVEAGSSKVMFGTAHVEKDGDKVKKVVYPDGQTNEIEYDGQGKPKKITNSVDGDAWERQKDDTWKHFDRDHKEIPPASGDLKDVKSISVTKDGDIIGTSSDGTTLRQNHDGSSSETHKVNGKDCVTNVTYPNGHKSDFEYDGQGNLIKFKSSETNEEWVKKEDGWKQVKDGNEIDPDPPVKEVRVSPDGDVTASLGDNSTATKNHDGSSILTEQINGKDLPVKVINSDGTIQELKYNANGEPIEWTTVDGGTFRKREDGKWSNLDDDGKEIEVLDIDVQVNPNGDISYSHKDKPYSELWRRDGTISIRDGKSKIEVNQNGDPTEIQHPDGSKTTVEYDKNDPPSATRIVRPNGSEWKQEGDSWYEYKNGKPTGETAQGFRADRDGDIRKKNAAGGTDETWLPDGGKEENPADKPRVVTDASGKMTEQYYRRPDGVDLPDYKYKDGKLVEAQTGEGKTWKREAAGKWQQYDGTKAIGKPQEIDLKVAQNGDCIIRRKDEVVGLIRRDGSQTEFKWNGKETRDVSGRTTEVVRDDGSSTKFNADNSSITRDADHRMTELKDKDGKVVRSAEYGSDGKPTKITFNDETYEKKDGAWTRASGEGMAEGLDIKVEPDGGITFIEESNLKVTHNVDGSLVTKYPDKTRVTEKPMGDNMLVTEVEDPRGNVRTIEYDQQGKVKSVSETSPDGKVRMLLGRNEQGTLVVIHKNDKGEDEGLVVGDADVSHGGDITVSTSGMKLIWTADGQYKVEVVPPPPPAVN